MPFANWSLIHNASTIAIGSCVAGKFCTYGTAVKVECATLAMKSLIEYKFDKIKWDTALHHVCMFVPCIIAQFPEYHSVNWWIMNMQITHIPFTFYYMAKLVKNDLYKKIFRLFYLTTWFPAIMYRSHIMYKSIFRYPEYWYVTCPITCSIIILDLYWTPWKYYKALLPPYK